MNNKIIVKVVDVNQVYPLRNKILRPALPIESCHYREDSIGEPIHLAANYHENIVGIASFYQENHPNIKSNKSYRLRGMAVDDEHRGSGVGKLMILQAIDICQQADADLLWCNARASAAGFYEKLGFNYHGGSFDLPDIGPHFVMFRKL